VIVRDADFLDVRCFPKRYTRVVTGYFFNVTGTREISRANEG
jgi:hypothetical protein